MFLNYFALGVLIFVFLVIFYGIIILHDIPYLIAGNDSNLLIVFYVQIMPDDLVMQLHRF